MNYLLDLIAYYRKKAEAHLYIGYISLSLGTCMAVLGLFVFSNFYSIEIPSKSTSLRNFIQDDQFRLQEIERKLIELKEKELKLQNQELNTVEKVIFAKSKLEKAFQDPNYMIGTVPFSPSIASLHYQRNHMDSFGIQIESRILEAAYESIKKRKEEETIKWDKNKSPLDFQYSDHHITMEMLDLEKTGIENIQIEIDRLKLDDEKDREKIYEKLSALENYLIATKNVLEERNAVTNKIINLDKLIKILTLDNEKLSIKAEIKAYEDQLLSIDEKATKTSDLILIISQISFRFGGLILIELLAFFFLKQFRLSLDESRYHTNIARESESNLIVYKILLNSKFKDLRERLSSLFFFERNNNKLDLGESSELLESKKINQAEIDIIIKLLDQIKELYKR